MRKAVLFLSGLTCLTCLLISTACSVLTNNASANPTSTLAAPTALAEKTAATTALPNPALAAALFQPLPAIISGSSFPVAHLSWSPDSALLASSSGSFDSTDYSVRLWHADGTPAGQMSGHSQPVTGLAWSPDGKILASSSLDGTTRLWGRDGTPVKILNGNAGHVFTAAWSPDGKLLATGSIVTVLNPTVQIWDLDGKIVQTLSTSFSGGKFYNLAWSPDGAYLLGGATDYKLWRADGSLVVALGGCDTCTPAWGMAWSPNSKLWAVGNESALVSIYTNQGQSIAMVHDQSSVNALSWSPDSRILAAPKTLWKADGTTVKVLAGQPEYVYSLAWSPDGKFLASGGSDGLVHLWTAAGESAGTLGGQAGEINVVAWSPDGKRLASASADKTIRLWQVADQP